MATIQGRSVGPIGYGLMGFGMPTYKATEEESFATMKQAIAEGSNFWNGGEFYGTAESNSLTLLHRYFTKYPEDADKVVICIKGAAGQNRVPDGTPEGIRQSVDNCLRMLGGVKKIDIFECARVDPNTPVETSISALADLVREGKIGGIGLSEVNADTIRRAAKIHPIAVVEVECSLLDDHILKNGVVEACADLKIPILAYSPVGHGLFNDSVQSLDDIPAGDWRHILPVYAPEHFPKNLELAKKVRAISSSKGCTSAQLAINWVRQLSERPKYPLFIPIPGTTSVARVKENSLVMNLTKGELDDIESVTVDFERAGERYPPSIMKYCDG